MTDIYQNELRIYKNKKKTKELRKATAKWVHGFKPTDFISIQFPPKQRSKSLDTSLKHLKTVMKYFEKQLCPCNWFNKQLFFIAFAEINAAKQYHFHIFLCNDRYPAEKIYDAMDKTVNHFNFSDSVIDIRPINTTPYKAYFYGNKDLKANARGHFESSRIILSDELFMKDKTISPYKEKTVHNT